jgi:hypothetical protein
MLTRPTGNGRKGTSGAIFRGQYEVQFQPEHPVDKTTSIDKFRVPIGNQEIELQQIEYESGGMPLLRLRIREHSRFTIFDIDSLTAERWGQQMVDWARAAQDPK